MLLETYALSIAGRRTSNEDAVCAQPELGLFVVAEGMGGYEGGEIASALAVDAIHSLVRHTTQGADVIWPYAIDHSMLAQLEASGIKPLVDHSVAAGELDDTGLLG